MYRAFLTAIAVLLVGLARPPMVQAQTSMDGWSERPDARAPAGISDDKLPTPGVFEVRYTLEVRNHEGILAGTNELVSGDLIEGDLGLWEIAPQSMTTQRHELEFRAGILDWLGASIRVPFRHTKVEFASDQILGTTSAYGLGDVEAHLLYGLHDIWPYRAHVNIGVAFPTGAVTEAGEWPDAPGERRTLPYPVQPGGGTFAILPGAAFVSENQFGTVGFRADARLPVGENDRGWSAGNQLSAQTWMSYRFNEWVSGSVRVTLLKSGNLDGQDLSLDPWSTPMAHPDLQGGTRVELPVGINFLFPEGPLQGNRMYLELFIPLHQDLDGPQLKSNYGGAISWGLTF